MIDVLPEFDCLHELDAALIQLAAIVFPKILPLLLTYIRIFIVLLLQHPFKILAIVYIIVDFLFSHTHFLHHLSSNIEISNLKQSRC